jgi:hypothetical protein
MMANALLGGVGGRDVYTRIGIFHASPAGIILLSGRTKVPVVICVATIWRAGRDGRCLLRFSGDRLKRPE